jgi:hypothetical protein
MFCVTIGQGADGIFTQAYTVLSSWVEREMQLGGKGDAAGWRGRCSWVEREMQPGGEGERLGADGWTARGVYSDGPRRLTRRPGASELEIFYPGIYVGLISD